MAVFKGSTVVQRWIRNQPTGQRNCGNSWESLWGRGLSRDHFLSVWIRDTQGCSSFPPRHLWLALSGKFVSLYGTGLNTHRGARVPIVFLTDKGPNMNMHIHKSSVFMHSPNSSPPLFIHLFIISLHLIFNSKWGIQHVKGYCVTPLKILQWQKKIKKIYIITYTCDSVISIGWLFLEIEHVWVDITRWVSVGFGETEVLNHSVFHEVNVILFFSELVSVVKLEVQIPRRLAQGALTFLLALVLNRECPNRPWSFSLIVKCAL